MNLNKDQKAAVQWLSNEIENIPNIVFHKEEKDTDIITEQADQLAPPLAELALFKYEAKYGNKIGYWDKFPIVLIVRPFNDHFYGFNLHYLDEEIRNKILSTVLNLHKKVPNKKVMYKTIYPFLDALVKIGHYNFAYKNYLYSNIASQFVIIKPQYYHMVSNLPIARFKGNIVNE